ncbi:MAG: hypothetical protein IPF50_00145 [Proteobacteria bacterium]|nr:hypothetical protein [Pseudomonadota bacterium]
MSAGGRQTGRKGRRKAVRKPPPHWRRYLTQAELELPPPAGGPPAGEADDRNDEFEYADAPDLAWWQSRLFVAGLAAACMLLAVLTVTSMINAAREREAARVAAEREQTLTLRAINSVRSLRIAPNPRSWSASPDLTLAWPEPPQLLELRLAVGYSPFLAFGVIVDKVDHGRCCSSNAWPRIPTRNCGCHSTVRRSAPANTACGCRATRGAVIVSTWAGCGCWSPSRADLSWTQDRISGCRSDSPQ